jgi:hypothetical protein
VEYWQMNIVRGMEKAVNLPSPNNWRQPDLRIFFGPL